MIRCTRPILVATLAILPMNHASAVSPIDALRDWAHARVESNDAGAIVVARIDGDTVSIQGYGRRQASDDTAPDAHTRFQIGSITKVFTNLLLAERVAADAVRYDQPIGNLLPDAFAPANPAVMNITLMQLATHGSGLPRLPPNMAPINHADPYAGFDDATLLAGLKATRAGQPLGRHYGYSNFGTGVLGHLLSRQAGSDYYALVDTHVVVPLKLGNTGRQPGDNHAQAISGGKPVQPWSNDGILIAASGGLWGSADDLARLIRAYLGTHPHALRHDLADDLKTVAGDDEGISVTRVWHVADADGQPIFWHNGSTMNYWSFAGFRPDTRQGVVVLSSGDADPTATALELLGHTPKPPPAQTVDTALLGQYRITDDFGIGAQHRHGRLFAQGSGQPPLPMHAIGDDWYALHEVDASLRLMSASADTPARIEYVQGGVRQHGERVADVADAARHIAIDLPLAQLDDYIGRYQLVPGVEFTIRRRDDSLEAMVTGQTWLTIHAAGDDRFFYREVDASLQFSRDGDGKVDALTLHQGAVVQRAPRLADAP